MALPDFNPSQKKLPIAYDQSKHMKKSQRLLQQYHLTRPKERQIQPEESASDEQVPFSQTFYETAKRSGMHMNVLRQAKSKQSLKRLYDVANQDTKSMS